MSKLSAGENEDQVETQIQQSAARGISGVPYFILNETFSLSGAQPTGSFVEAFDQLVDQ
jgi:predicted DsbA family dithiol-disulfide isomerase